MHVIWYHCMHRKNEQVKLLGVCFDLDLLVENLDEVLIRVVYLT